jgi:putative sporulation protein YyaC
MKIYYIDALRPGASDLVARRLKALLCCFKNEFRKDPVFLCIGSDRVTGDSLGPIIGSRLKRSCRGKIPVYGTMEKPVHALNLSQALEHIRIHHPDQMLIAIDACLGAEEHLGYITLGRGSLTPGAGVSRDLESAGDLFITGIVGVSGGFPYLTLQTTGLARVVAVAEAIAEGILNIL